MAKKLITYYSRADENYVNGIIKVLDIGNTGLFQKLQQMHCRGTGYCSIA